MKDIRIKTTPLLMLALLGMQGCGSGSGTAPAGPNVAAAHGGNLLTLPGGKGFVEFLVEAPAGSAAKTKKSEVVVYFLKADGSGPLAPAPSDVTFTPDGGSTITLKPEGGVLQSGRYVSEAGLTLAAGRDVTGELSANLGGTVVKVTVLAR